MMPNRIVSIVVPVFNAQKYIKECIESIINQTYKDIQVIIVDDGSTDNSLKICEELKKKTIEFILLNNIIPEQLRLEKME